ncbi:beta-glucosidase [Thalassotalea montiporae]
MSIISSHSLARQLRTASLLAVTLSCSTAVLAYSAGDKPEQEQRKQDLSLYDLNLYDLNKNGQLERYENPAIPVAERVQDLIARMSLTQKINMLMGTGFTMDAIGGSNKVPGAAGETFPLKEFGIPSIVLADGPAGLRISPHRQDDEQTYYATAFPTATLLASSWNTKLLELVGAAMGQEAKEYGVDVFLAPGMNIQLNPLGGRAFEYYSEDPVLSGNMAAAMVNGVESNGIGSTIKHYVANNIETNRMHLDTVVSGRAMREIYLKGFEIAIAKSQPWAVMSSYNKVNGTYASQSNSLLLDVLRDELGFKGLVMSDWFAGDDSAQQVAAGNDLIMPGSKANEQQIIDGLEQGRLTEQAIDRNLARVLNTVFHSPVMQNYQYSNKPNLQAHATLARNAAAEGIVLLKNNGNALPLAKHVKSVATFGNTSFDFIAGGSGSGDVNEAYTVSLAQGLEQAGFSIDNQLQSSYSEYIATEKAKQPKPKFHFLLPPPIGEMGVSTELIAEKAKQADIALITIGRNAGEFADRQIANDFTLSDKEQQLIEQVSNAFHKEGKKVVVLLNVGGIIEIASWRDKVDAIALVWQGGQEAGNAAVDVLTGKVNPSGKLTATIPLRYQDLPNVDGFPGEVLEDKEIVNPYINMPSGKPSRTHYHQDIYVGYRYFDTFAKDVAYPFGYGLSYTAFAYKSPNFSFHKLGLDVEIDVTNTGLVTGKEAIQLYVGAPQGKLAKPAQELKAFNKTRQLQPGESERLSLKVDLRDLASFDEQSSRWIVEPGKYQVFIGASSRDIRQQFSFTVDKEYIVSDKLTRLTASETLNIMR